MLLLLLLCCCSIGLQGSEGIGLIGYNSATLVTLGGCPLENRVYQYSVANTSAAAVCVNNPDTGLLEAKLGPPSSSYMCAVRECSPRVGVAGREWAGGCCKACIHWIQRLNHQQLVLCGCVAPGTGRQADVMLLPSAVGLHLLLLLLLVLLQSKRMHSASLWLGIAGLTLMVLLMGRRFKGSIMVGILFVTFISW